MWYVFLYRVPINISIYSSSVMWSYSCSELRDERLKYMWTRWNAVSVFRMWMSLFCDGVAVIVRRVCCCLCPAPSVMPFSASEVCVSWGGASLGGCSACLHVPHSSIATSHSHKVREEGSTDTSPAHSEPIVHSPRRSELLNTTNHTQSSYEILICSFLPPLGYISPVSFCWLVDSSAKLHKKTTQSMSLKCSWCHLAQAEKSHFGHNSVKNWNREVQLVSFCSWQQWLLMINLWTFKVTEIRHSFTSSIMWHESPSGGASICTFSHQTTLTLTPLILLEEDESWNMSILIIELTLWGKHFLLESICCGEFLTF